MKSIKLTGNISIFTAALLASLGSVSGVNGATPTQEMSRTVETLCPSLKAAYTSNPAALSSAEQDVLFRCGELKLGAGQSFVNLSEAQRNGLGNMTSDESSVMGAATVALSGAQNIAILGRLTGLRAKTTSSVAANGGTGSPAEGMTSRPNTSSILQSNNPVIDNGVGGNVVVNPIEIKSGYDGNFSQMSDYGKWGVFVNGSYGSGNKDATLREPGFDFDSWSLVSGLDYRVTDQLILGLALGYAVTNSSIDKNGGDVDLDGFGGSLYGTYYVGNFYVDFLAGAAAKRYETERNVSYSVAGTGGITLVNQVFDGDTDATDVNFGLGTGYNLTFGGLAVTPFAHIAYLESNIDGYTESLEGQNSNSGFGLALRVDDQEVKSLASTLGLQLAYAINTSRGVLTPYFRADWEHEFENDARNITAHFSNVGSNFDALNRITIPTDDPDRDFVNFGAGLSAVFPGGLQCFIDYSTVLGYEDITLHRFVAGLRVEF